MLPITIGKREKNEHFFAGDLPEEHTSIEQYQRGFVNRIDMKRQKSDMNEHAPWLTDIFSYGKEKVHDVIGKFALLLGEDSL